MSNGRPATQLGPNGRAVLKGHAVEPVEDLDKWRIVEETGERVALTRELDEAPPTSNRDAGVHPVREITEPPPRPGS